MRVSLVSKAAFAGVLCTLFVATACSSSSSATPESAYLALAEAGAPCDRPVINNDELLCPSDWLKFGKYPIYFFGSDYPFDSLESSIEGEDECPEWGLDEIILGSNWWSPGASDELEAYLIDVLGGERTRLDSPC